ncbi:MAG TPA: molybdopterin molybdotransferase MoeA [Nevskiales bacterium]|nr:molybdopterin molybdotransferase MoeA [Nevskiales bacterium]
MVFHPPPPAETRDPARAAPAAAERPTEPLEPVRRLTPLGQALIHYNQTLLPLPVESIATEQALNRCLAEAPLAAIDLPSFTQSAVDGYALLSFETQWASPTHPVQLRVIGEIAAGPWREDPPPLAGHMAYRILTGGRIPRGVDTVVAQEQAQVEGDSIRLEAPVPEKRNIRYAGEELKRGDALAAAGQRISPGMLAALMAAGTHTIKAYRRPRVSVLVTGDEVVAAGQLPSEGQVHDANGPLIRSWMQALGYPPPQVSYIKDVRTEVESALCTALDQSDLVITTGGVSVGDRDYLPQAAAACGVRQVFWKVAQKPGKPLYYGLRGQTPLLALPGNPAAVLVGLVIHARRVLDCLEGVATPGPRMSAGRLLQPVKADPLRDRLLRMNLSINTEGQVQLEPLPKQDSHMLSNLATAMALVMLPAREQPYAAGERVLWTPLPGVTRI